MSGAPDVEPRRELVELADASLAEVRRVLEGVDPRTVEAFLDELGAARRIALHGVGREGLMVRAFAMRLFHLGLAAHVVGDVTTPPLGPGDLLVASSGPGDLATVLSLMQVARRAGARVLVVTAQSGSEAARGADRVVLLPAVTMADDVGGARPVLPMGSTFEIAQLVFFDCSVQVLARRLGVPAEAMRSRHTNLE